MFEGAQRALGLSCRKPNVTIITQVAPPSTTSRQTVRAVNVFAALFAQIAYNQRRNDGLYVEAAWNVSQNDTDKPNVAATSRETTTNITTTSQRDKWNQASFVCLLNLI